jgi:hypothetical protein
METLSQMKAEGKISGETQVLEEATQRFAPLDHVLGKTGGLVLPAPPPKANRYFYADQRNTPVGPFTIDELQQQFLAGNIYSETQVITEGGTAWQLYSALMMQRLSASGLGAVIPPPPASNPGQASLPWTICWFIMCFPVGWALWGQAAKGWLWFLITLMTGGLAVLGAMVDYWMCYSVQQRRKLGEWEFFPRR